jgi:hypothetical protein
VKVSEADLIASVEAEICAGLQQTAEIMKQK